MESKKDAAKERRPEVPREEEPPAKRVPSEIIGILVVGECATDSWMLTFPVKVFADDQMAAIAKAAARTTYDNLSEEIRIIVDEMYLAGKNSKPYERNGISFVPSYQELRKTGSVRFKDGRLDTLYVFQVDV